MFQIGAVQPNSPISRQNSNELAVNSCNDDLDIHVAAPEGWTFAPGDPVIGTIVRRSRIATPEAIIYLVLKGDVNVADSIGPRTDYPGPQKHVAGERNKFTRQLLDPRKQVIFRGPLHINGSDDAGSWPFEVRVPYSSWRGTQDEDTGEGSDPPRYESNDGDENRLLPGTFRVYGPTSCWSRYYIEAEIRYILGGVRKIYTKTLNIQLKTPASRFRGFGSQTGTATGTVQSHYLLPGMEESSLSFRQKRQSFFASSQIPRFYYEIHISAPTTIQLNNRDPFPFKFRFTTLDRSSDTLRETPPEVGLSSLRMSLVSTTRIKCLQPYQDSATASSRWIFYTHKLKVEDAFKNIASDSPLKIPSGEKEDPLDIGELLQLTLHSNGLMAGRDYIRRGVTIVPDMTAAYTRRTHSLDVDFSVVIAGKTEEHHWAGPIKII